MPQVSPALLHLPAAGAKALARLGHDLGTARKRRKQSLRQWAERLGVSVPTLMKMERGDAAVSIGLYVTALYMINRHEAIAHVADPKEDAGALQAEVTKAEERYRRPGARSG